MHTYIHVCKCAVIVHVILLQPFPWSENALDPASGSGSPSLSLHPSSSMATPHYGNIVDRFGLVKPKQTHHASFQQVRSTCSAVLHVMCTVEPLSKDTTFDISLIRMVSEVPIEYFCVQINI